MPKAFQRPCKKLQNHLTVILMKIITLQYVKNWSEIRSKLTLKPVLIIITTWKKKNNWQKKIQKRSIQALWDYQMKKYNEMTTILLLSWWNWFLAKVIIIICIMIILKNRNHSKIRKKRIKTINSWDILFWARSSKFCNKKNSAKLSWTQPH
jgi:hypothetical protein